MSVRLMVFALLGLLPFELLVASTGLVWPTPNRAFGNGESIEAFVQHTSSGKVESGLFGCVRNSGAKFHEGLDLYPIKRNSRGEALDSVYSVLRGRVVHVSRTAGHSSYGRYVVVVHDGESLAFHSLYAHLASIDSAIQVGSRVEAGAVLGIMGRSAAGYSIPRSRSHVHLELGVKLTDNFQVWFDRQKLGSPNKHGNWNGLNLVSVDPLDFYRKMRDGKVSGFHDYLKRLPVVARIRVHSSIVPSFVQNYPALVTRSFAERDVVAWDIAFTQFGVPKEWTPRFAEEKLPGSAGEVRVLTYDPRLLKSQTCRHVIRLGGRVPSIAPGTVTIIKKLFGFR